MGEETTITQEIADPEVVTAEVVESESTEEIKEDTVSVEQIVAEPVKEKKSAIQQRIDELTAKRYAAEKRAQLLEEQLSKQKDTIVTSDRPIPPVEGEFADPDEFRKARIEYEDKVDAWRAQHNRSVEITAKQKQEMDANIAKFNENAARMRGKYADFDQAINEPLFSPEMSAEVMASDFGPEIGYYLAKNPTEAMRLSKLSPTGIAKEIGKLEVKFTQAKSKITTNAPDPLKPIKGDDVVEKDPSKMSMNEWVQWDRKRTLEKIKTRGVL